MNVVHDRTEKTIRVHHIANSYSSVAGGAERVVRSLHCGLRRQGVESYICGLLQQPDRKLSDARSLGLSTAYTPRAFRGLYHYLRANVRQGDIVHVHLFPSLLYASLLKRLRPFKFTLVATEHSTSNRRRNTVLGRAVDALTYAPYDHLVAISDGVRQELLKWQPRLGGKVRVIPNGADLIFDRSIVRNHGQPLKVLSVGSLRPAKNYDTVLQAIARLSGDNFEYLIAGEGQCREELNRLRQRLQLQSKVQFLGHVQAVPELLAAADIFLMPSRWEGFGLAAVEAMNASLPLIVSDVPGFGELVATDPPCALLVDPRSPRDIAGALQRLLHDPDLRSRLGASAFHRASHFTTDRMIHNYLDFYHEVA